ncbi:MAG: Y-family DNA polymerase [Planctomycetia bacterium]|nr:Y-family DNA polymerase [Planctomycetia bacterium]
MKIIGLLDCNSFFASCEKVFHPAWQNRPVIVLSNNDGCVVARSPEAKQLQIPMGVPFFQIRSFAERNQVVVCSANFCLYGDMSRRVMQTLQQWTPDIQIYSIDESFFDLTGRFIKKPNEILQYSASLEESLLKLGKEIVQTVPMWTGIPVAIGIGPNKTLAKVANHLAKKGNNSVCSLLNEAKRLEILKKVEISDIWGVGRHLLPKFQRLGLRTAFDLSNVDPLWMRKNFSIVQEQMVRELQGEFCFDDVNVPETHKNIQVSRTFGESLEDLNELEKAVSTFAAKGAEKLRRQKSVTSAIQIQLYTNWFRKEQDQYYPARVIGLPYPTSNTFEIVSQALIALRSIFKPNLQYRKAAVILLNLIDEKFAAAQKTLFNLDPTKSPESREKEKRLIKAIDLINQQTGSNRIFLASEGIDPQWKPNANYISPCFTTRWEDIPVAQ